MLTYVLHGGLSLYLGEVEEWGEFEEFYAKNANVAEYYFCRNNELPYYYGIVDKQYLEQTDGC